MNTTSTHDTEIVVDAEVPMVRIIREFDASPAKSSEPTSTPSSSSSGTGPAPPRCASSTTTAAPAGHTATCTRRRTASRPASTAAVHEVRPDELIVQTFCFEGMPDGVALEKLLFEDLGDGRTRLTATSLIDSFADRDAFVASGMEVGVREGYEGLDDLRAG